MTFVNDEEYGKEDQFTQEKLLSPLTPDDVRRSWMCQIPIPGPDANPTSARSSTLMFWKKAISFFMPNRLLPWNAISGVGNPTRYIEVNDLIKKVTKRKSENKGRSHRLDIP
jgi:hypothetical protein